MDPHPTTYPPAALITGAGKRLGRAIALGLAEAGFSIAVHYRGSAREAEETASEVAEHGVRAITLQADLAKEAEVETLIPAANEALGTLGVLVNNASVFDRDEIDTMTRGTWDHHLEPNLRAPLVLAQAFARQLPFAAGGVVINLLDQRVWNLTPYFLSYTVSKGALWTLTQTLALALAPRIRVNGIGPGPALPSPHQTQEQFDAQCRSMPLRRGTTPEEIAAAARFLVATPSITGQMIALDGGQHLGWAQPGPSVVPD